MPGVRAPTYDPSGLTLSIVSTSAIGKHLARKAFDITVRYYNRRRLSANDERAYSATYCPTLHGLVASSNVVSLNCPLNDLTIGLIGAAEFAAMKGRVFLIDTARGAVVDEPAFIDALESGKVAHAGLKVFVNKPSPNPYFLESSRVIIQPHLGGLTDSAFPQGREGVFREHPRPLRHGEAQFARHGDQGEAGRPVGGTCIACTSIDQVDKC